MAPQATPRDPTLGVSATEIASPSRHHDPALAAERSFAPEGPTITASGASAKSTRPGDVGYFTSNAHHCIIASVNGDQIETIDGNSYDGSSGGNGAITSKTRSRHDFAAFFKQVDD